MNAFSWFDDSICLSKGLLVLMIYPTSNHPHFQCSSIFGESFCSEMATLARKLVWLLVHVVMMDQDVP